MKIERFEDILAWQKAKELSLGVYKSLNDCRDFPFKNQLQRAAVSVMNNIAEGFERKSNKEFANFLFIAKGSCGETRSMLALGKELGYFSSEDFGKLSRLSEEASRMMSGLIKKL